MTIFILIATFAIFLVLGLPIAFAIGLSTLFTMVVTIDFIPAITTVAQRMAGGLDSFSLLAVPLFILSGHLMGQGGIARRLIGFAGALLSRLPGGLALVNVISNSLFGSISGSSVAATSAIGSFMVPEMEKQGYPRSFSAALTATASTTGLLIPPSNILIIYAVASGGVSISALFVAGYIPGIAVMIGLMIVSFFYARKAKTGLVVPAMEQGALLRKTWEAFPSLFLIFLIIGGILAGIYTATEAGAIAVAYAFVLSTFVYRELSLKDLPTVLVKGVKTTAMVMFLIGSSMAMSWVLAYENVPTSVANTLLGITDNPIMLLLIINITLLIVGAFLDITPAVLIFTPIFLPVAVSLSMSPLQFGIMLVLNLSIGLCTPPVGSVLFVACAVARTKITDLIKPLLPMYAAMIAALLLVTYVASVSEFLPRLFGLIE